MTDEQQTIPDPTSHMDFDVEAGELIALSNRLNQAEAFDETDTDEIAELVSALKTLEKAVKEARKEHIEPVLSDRVEVGGVAYDLRRVERNNRYIVDDKAAFGAVKNAGHNPADVASVSVTDLVDVLGQSEASEYIGTRTSDYFRREG